MANRLLREIPISGIVVDLGRRQTLASSIKRALRRYTLTQLCGRLVLFILRWIFAERARRATRLRNILGVDSVHITRPELVQRVHGINTDAGVQTVAELNPDLLLVFGTSIVGPRVTSLARRCALNAHTGISPYYRGADCAFWPVHNLDLHMLGATVHECTAAIDGGRMFATGRVQLEENDCLTSVFARCVMVAADLYASVVRQLQDRTLHSEAQNLTLGREYKASDRGLCAEIRARYLVMSGVIRRHVAAQRNQRALHPHRTRVVPRHAQPYRRTSR